MLRLGLGEWQAERRTDHVLGEREGHSKRSRFRKKVKIIKHLLVRCLQRNATKARRRKTMRHICRFQSFSSINFRFFPSTDERRNDGFRSAARLTVVTKPDVLNLPTRSSTKMTRETECHCEQWITFLFATCLPTIMGYRFPVTIRLRQIQKMRFLTPFASFSDEQQMCKEML